MAKRIKTNWGRTKKVRRNTAWALWRIRKKHRDYDGVLLPPVTDELLIWLKGNSTDTQKTDSWKDPDAENFDIKQSNCIALNGVDEIGTIPSGPWNNLQTLDLSFRCNLPSSQSESYVGVISKTSNTVGWSIDRGASNTNTELVIKTSVGQQNKTFPVDIFDDTDHLVSIVITETTWSVIVDGTEASGTYNLGDGIVNTYPVYFGRTFSTRFSECKLWDITLNGTHFRIAEGNESPYSWSDDGTRYITWTGSLDEMWAQRQDSYHANANLGYWTSDPPDGIYYPCNPDLL